MTNDAGVWPGLKLECANGVAWLVIDRPERRNAIDRLTRRSLVDATAALEADSEVKVLVITGSGAAFCAGTDQSEPAEDAGLPPFLGPLHRIAACLEGITKPVLAAVNGPAMGGGFEIVLASDIRVASTSARFGLPEVRIGTLPASGGTQRLFSALPSAIAWKMLFTGESIDAHEAHRIGLVSDVVAPVELRPYVDEIAHAIVRNAPLSIRAAKLAGRAALDRGLNPGLELERALWGFLKGTEDRAEARMAFRDKRRPHFRGR